MKKTFLALLAILPIYANAGFEIEDGALKTKQEQRTEEAQKKADEVSAASAKAEALKKRDASNDLALANMPAKLSDAKSGASMVVDEKRGDPIWILKPESSMRAVVTEWAARAGWQVEWKVDDEQTREKLDYTLGGGFHVNGTFKDAITKLVSSLPASLKVHAQFWSENDPPMLYVIKGEGQL